jgi:hypothetical protein
MPEIIVPWHTVPSPPHIHRCLSPRCQGRQWDCTQPDCLQIPAYNNCSQCLPTGPFKPARTVALAWSVWS